MLRVKDILELNNRSPICIGPEETISTAIKKLVENNIGALPVCDGAGNMLGIISERDMLRLCATNADATHTTKVHDVMKKDVFIGFPEDRVDYAAGIMAEKGIKHLPIMDGAKIIGVISLRDIVQAQVELLKVRLETCKAQVLNYLDA